MYKYIGVDWIVGVPARDISAEEFALLDSEAQAMVQACGLYEIVASKMAKEKR